MKKIVQIPTKSDKISIFVMITEKMVKDFCDCSRKAYTMSGKDCDTCSWGDLTIGDVGMYLRILTAHLTQVPGKSQRLKMAMHSSNFFPM